MRVRRLPAPPSVVRPRTNMARTEPVSGVDVSIWRQIAAELVEEWCAGRCKSLDLSRVLTGPWASMALGDLGAEVWRVEQPGSGDDTRGRTPPSVEGVSTAERPYVVAEHVPIHVDRDVRYPR
jgi:hypothetical protein